jgi:hypothetical protein
MGDKMKLGERDSACGTYGGEQRQIQHFGGQTCGTRPLRRPGCRWEDNIKMDHKGIGWESMDWMDLAQDRDKWQAVVNSVMDFRFCVKWGIVRLAEELSASEEGLCCRDMVI